MNENELAITSGFELGKIPNCPHTERRIYELTGMPCMCEWCGRCGKQMRTCKYHGGDNR